ncbi:MAG: hypothetical protein J6I52_00780 [Prevotella sp.]|nr:hypothetical protein [Prevotella sp.]
MNKKSYITPATMVVQVKTCNALMQTSVNLYRGEETTDSDIQLSRRCGSVWDDVEDECY